MTKYQAIRARQRDEINAFPFGAAFTEKQFDKMMSVFGLPNDKNGRAKIVTLGGGVYLKRADLPSYREMSDRHEREIKQLMNDPEEFKAALRYEFQNHESQFNRNDNDILVCFGLSVEKMNKDERLKKLYSEAWREFYRDCVKNDWF